jgi:hypothetical protein
MRHWVQALALLLSCDGCLVVRRIQLHREWYEQDPTRFVARRHRWLAEVPAMDGAFDVERYELARGGAMLTYRSNQPFDTAWTTLFDGLLDAGWNIVDNRGSFRRRALTACWPDCDTRRYYVVAIRGLGDDVRVVVRAMGPQEFAKPVPLEGPCVEPPYARAVEAAPARYAPVFDFDLDRDGRLDLLVPRVDEDAKPVPGERMPMLWDVYVTRGACGVMVATLPDVPADDVASPTSEGGLIDLAVRRRVTVDGQPKRVLELHRFAGGRYVASNPPT